MKHQRIQSCPRYSLTEYGRRGSLRVAQKDNQEDRNIIDIDEWNDLRRIPVGPSLGHFDGCLVQLIAGTGPKSFIFGAQ